MQLRHGLLLTLVVMTIPLACLVEAPAPLWYAMRAESRGGMRKDIKIRPNGVPLELTLRGKSSLYAQRPVQLRFEAKYTGASQSFEFNFDTIRVIRQGHEMRMDGKFGSYVPRSGVRDEVLGDLERTGREIRFVCDTDLPNRYDSLGQMEPDLLTIILDGFLRYQGEYVKLDTVVAKSF